jgi:two-component system response regulator AtoC
MNERKQNVLVIDDETGMRHMLRLVLEREGFVVEEAQDAESGLSRMESGEIHVVLCDIRMPGMDGLGFLREVSLRKLSSTIIMMSAYGSLAMAMECMKQGAYDYITKPFKPDEVVLTLRKAEERQRLVSENARLLREIKGQAKPGKIVHCSVAMQKVLDLVARVAQSSSPVLVCGETGTGKELIARSLHDNSDRHDGPFVAVNCSAIASGLLESELFGHAKGAFTGADREHKGLFAAADGGTLFLDEIGELPLELQPKLLRVLQEGELRRVGETRPVKVDVRLLTATARNLQDEIEAGRFRDDLFYRLAVVEIGIPALRERQEDIPLLAQHFIGRIAEREQRPVPAMTPEVLALLTDYAWPGNVRELENFIEKTMIFCRGPQIDLNCLPWESRRESRGGSGDFSLKSAMERLEKEYIRKALAATGGNRTQAAKLLEISLRALHYKMNDYHIE